MVGAERFRRARLASALLGLPWSDATSARCVSGRMRRSSRSAARTSPIGCRRRCPTRSQKRVALARALVAEPELLLLDEPAGGLGADEMSELAKLISSLRSTIAVMLVDHHMDLVTSVCDRMVVLDFGRVIASGAPPEVRQDARVLEAYLGRDAERESDGRTGGAADARD